MPTYSNSDDLTVEQAEALNQAALYIVNARKEAAEMLRRVGIEPPLPGAPAQCGAVLTSPPPPRACSCNQYLGVEGGPCRTRFTGPDLGEGPILITCQHPEDAHITL